MLENNIDSFWDLSWDKKFAYLFNRTALGIGFLVGCWHLWQHNWWNAFLVFGILFPVYFWLWHAVDAP